MHQFLNEVGRTPKLKATHGRTWRQTLENFTHLYLRQGCSAQIIGKDVVLGDSGPLVGKKSSKLLLLVLFYVTFFLRAPVVLFILPHF